MSVLAETSLHAKPWRDAKAAIASFTASLMCYKPLRHFHSAAGNSTFQQLKLSILLQVFLIGSPEQTKISFGILCPCVQKYMYTLLTVLPVSNSHALINQEGGTCSYMSMYPSKYCKACDIANGKQAC